MNVITFHDDGTMSCIGDPISKDTLIISRKRASHIVPTNPIKCAAFHILRFLFGESGRVAECTRQWNGPWKCRLVGSNKRFTHISRKVCVCWEISELTK